MDEFKVPKDKKKKKKSKDHQSESSVTSVYHSICEGDGLSSPSKKHKKKHKYSMDMIEEELVKSPSKKLKVGEDEISSTSSPKKISTGSDEEYIKKKSKKKNKEIKVENNYNAVENEIDAETDVPASSEIVESLGWPKEDLEVLISKIEKTIPADDKHRPEYRVQQIDWDEIKFKGYSGEECKEMWDSIYKKIRKFRLLKEIAADARILLDKPWYNFYGSVKKNRNPNQPKRPLSVYMCFYMDKKDHYYRKYPKTGVAELSKILGAKFRQLSDSKRAKYELQAKQLKAEYELQMKKFKEDNPNSTISIKEKIKKEKDEMPGPPKPLTPLQLFIEEKSKHYQDNQEMSKKDIITEIKELWKNMSNKKKVPWLRWAKESEEKYLEELKLYKSENPNFQVPKHKSLLSKEEIAILERMEGKPVKPPNSGYSLFSRIMLNDEQLQLVNFNPKEKMREISRLWSEVSEEEKKQYQLKAKNLMNNYKLEYASYLESLPEDKRIEELAKNVRKSKDVGNKDAGDSAISGGKKLKQATILDTLKKKKKKEIKEVKVKEVEDFDEGEESDDEAEPDGETDPDSEPNLKVNEKNEEIKKKIIMLEPPKPCENAFSLFKQIFLTNPANKESKAKLVWDAMPSKEKDRYKKKLEAQKQTYMIKYNAFLKQLKPEELIVLNAMKVTSGPADNNSSSETCDDEPDSESSEDSEDEPQKTNVKSSPLKSVSMSKPHDSSSSEDSD